MKMPALALPPDRSGLKEAPAKQHATWGMLVGLMRSLRLPHPGQTPLCSRTFVQAIAQQRPPIKRLAFRT
jgi:hypothetical protein